MKKLAFVTMILFTLCLKNVDAQMVTVLEVITYENGVYVDSVFVINPNGIVNKYDVIYCNSNFDYLQHNKEINAIYNSIINQGYKVFSIEEATLSLRGISYFIKPWTPASSELEQVKESHLNIKGFPNPTDGVITVEIEFDKGYKPTELAIINEAGYIVQLEQIQVKNGDRVTVDLSGQKAGIYFITAKNTKQYSALFKCILK